MNFGLACCAVQTLHAACTAFLYQDNPPARLGYLVVDLAQRRGRPIAEDARDNHEILAVWRNPGESRVEEREPERSVGDSIHEKTPRG
jgi:hypothetical protein